MLFVLEVLTEGISDTRYARDKLVAGYLAQEGVEYIRNMRDTLMLYSSSTQAGWDTFNTKLSNGSCTGGNGCYFDDRDLWDGGPMPMANQVTISSCGASCPALLYDSATGKYNYVSGVTTDFARKITVTQINNNEIEISSTAYWRDGAGEKSLTLSENLFNWIE